MPVCSGQLDGLRWAAGRSSAGREVILVGVDVSGAWRKQVSLGAGAVRTVPGSDVDITERCWPLPAKPGEKDTEVAYADISLLEDLGSGHLPPHSAARGNVLDG